MAEDRPFPPSARRRALARAAGLHAASPLLVGALACAGAVITVVTLGRVAAARLGAWIAQACESTARVTHDGVAHDGVAGAGSSPDPGAVDALLRVDDLPRSVLEIALPVLVAAALAALVGHLVQARAVWLPRRRIEGAPAIAPHRVRRAALDLVATAAVGGVAFGWLWLLAPRLSALPQVPLTGALLVASFVGVLAIAWVGLGVGDALVRHAELAAALFMTSAEKREDERLAGADPRWQRRRAEVLRDARRGRPATPTASAQLRDAIAGATVLVLGDDVAVAIAWDPVHRPVPVRTASGHGPRATQLLALARRHALAVHRDAALASALGAADGAVAEEQWPRLAEVVAALGPRSTR